MTGEELKKLIEKYGDVKWVELTDVLIAMGYPCNIKSK